MPEIAIRPLTEADWPSVEAIYAAGIATGNATFETTPPSWDEFDTSKLTEHRLVAEPASITIMGSGRLGPTAAALFGLAAVVLGARTFARARRTDQISSTSSDHRPTALLLGLTAVLLGGVFLVTADGGPGTGNGVVASAAAIVLGLIAIGLDRLATRTPSAVSKATSGLRRVN